MLNEQNIRVDKLLLDSDNPRFISDLTAPTRTPDDLIDEKQQDTLKRFSRTPSADDPEFDVTNIRDLYDSMLRIGFVGIDRIVVRVLGDKFLVLEGNRRLATVKSILRDYEHMRPPLDRPDVRRRAEAHMDSFTILPAMVLDTTGLSADELYQKVAIILGIRHHGSVLEWEPLPKAYNIYSEYMEEEPQNGKFFFQNKTAKQVAARLCIKASDVKNALRTYVAFLQARERFPEVKDSHFSLIEYAVRDKHLTSASYLSLDGNTFELEELSLTKLDTICQFATRDSGNPELTKNKKKKILKDPKHCKLLGRLIAKSRQASHPSITAYAANLIERVEDEDDLQMSLDQAVDDLTAFENRTKWVEAIGNLLGKQEKELDVEKYAGEGLDRGRKDELQTTLDPLRKMMNL